MVPNAREVLCSLYAKTLSVVQGFPRHSGYRRHTEAVVQQRLTIVQADSSPEGIERKIGCGQMEELIDQVGYITVLIHDILGWDALVYNACISPYKIKYSLSVALNRLSTV